MIVIKLTGGLGNQLFQYAYGRYISNHHHTKLMLDTLFYESQQLRTFDLHVFNIQAGMISQRQRNAFELPPDRTMLSKIIYKFNRLVYKNSIVIEPRFSYCPELMDIPSHVYVEGYFQSEKYFNGIKKILQKELTLNQPLGESNEKMKTLIRSSNAISVHIRRGDYVSNSFTNSVHGTCDINYYQNAIAHMNANVKDPVFFIFSDDLNWARTNLTFNTKSVHFVDLNTPDKSYFDLHLMHHCQHHIIANSSFSWWGAWLQDNPGKIVIAPKKWFNDPSKDTRDLLPETWMRL